MVPDPQHILEVCSQPQVHLCHSPWPTLAPAMGCPPWGAGLVRASSTGNHSSPWGS